DAFYYDYSRGGTPGPIHTSLDITLGRGSDSAVITSPCPSVPFGNPVVDAETNITVRTGDKQNHGDASDQDSLVVPAINDVNPGVHLNVTLLGDEGTDVLDFEQYGGIGRGGTVNLKMDGGAGDDYLVASVLSFGCTGVATLDGEMHWNVDGGSGNDHFYVDLSITGGAGSGASTIDFRGGAGADAVEYYQDDPTSTVSTRSDGGKDAGDTATIVIYSGNAPRITGFPGGVF